MPRPPPEKLSDTVLELLRFCVSALQKKSGTVLELLVFVISTTFGATSTSNATASNGRPNLRCKLT